MLWLFACASNEMKVAMSADETYEESHSWEDDTASEESTTEGDEADSELDTSYRWWSLGADVHIGEEGLNKSKSRIYVQLFNESMSYICTYNFSIEEALPAEPSFEEGILWWRMLLVPAVEELQSGDCTSIPNIPTTIQLGIGTLHMEIQAIWNQIDWIGIEAPSIEVAFSSYVSLDNGDNIWVYGGAATEISTIEELPNILYLRPAYRFSIDE